MQITPVFHHPSVIFGARFKNTTTSSVWTLIFAHIQLMTLQLPSVIFGIRIKIAQLLWLEVAGSRDKHLEVEHCLILIVLTVVSRMPT
jgi:hypothetical protein